ncbi:beta-propeller domain-containing protein [Candidatus Peregrinibacteria bacterium]|nr:MAG: beta-propeller domain-containing protein [Candidatus Peregrinibacteria bacterium]
MKKKIILLLASLKIVISILSFSALTQAESTFSDLDSEDPSLIAIETLEDNGVLQGYPDGSFRSTDTINRAEFIKMVAEAQEDDFNESNCFPDVTSDWYAKYVCYAKTEGWVEGYEDGLFRPANPINFAEASKILVRAFELEEDPTLTPWYRPHAEALEDLAAIPPSIGDFEKELMRGEMAEMVWRLSEEEYELDSLTYEDLEGNLIALNSCEELEALFLSEPRDYYYTGYPEEGDAADVSATPSAPTDYSSTNVQVEGVDEFDIIKNDEEYLYTLKDNQVHILDLYPAEAMNTVATLTFDDLSFTPSQMTLSENRLVVVGSEYDYDGTSFHSNRTGVYIYDVTDPSEPSLLRDLHVDGYYENARRIEDELYLILNKNAGMYWGDYDTMPTQIAAEEVLPHLTDSLTGVSQEIAPCEAIRYMPRTTRLSYVITLAIPLVEEDPVDAEVFIGSSDNLYVSNQNIYLSRSTYSSPSDYYYDASTSKTLIHRIALDEGQIEYTSSGKISGTFLNQFSMDEHEGYLRVASQVSSVQGSQGLSSRLTILDENMNAVSSIANLAPGETLHAARFMGDRGYLVTFEKVDPLFAFDLSDPRNPELLGELKIPGYSDYLHPYGDHYLIGFGKDVTNASAEQEALRELNFSWYQGLKVALFDVEDVSNPQQLYSLGIGDRGTDSELLYDHKALLFDPISGQLSFPVTLAQHTEENPDSNEFGETAFQGAYFYSIDPENGFLYEGRATHYEDGAFEDGSYYASRSEENYINRIIYIGDTFYTLSEGKVRALSRESLEEVGEVSL